MNKAELIAILRNRKTPMVEFKRISNQLAAIIAGEIKKEFSTSDGIVLVPILRAGMALLTFFMHAFESARVGFIGIYRDEKAKPHLYYENLPTLSPSDQVIILDPMVATGGSTLVTIDKLLSAGASPSHITVVGMIGAPEGKEAILSAYPEINLRLAILDDKLNDRKYIVPGLGDFGDRFFGT